MKEEALSKDCNPKQVEQKINHLQEKWKEAHDWVTGETGAGVWLGNEGSWKDSVLKKCQYYFDLYNIFADRASAQPKITTDGMNSSSDEANSTSTNSVNSV